MDDFAEIRRLHRTGLSARKIARQLGVGRDTVRNALANAEPVPYTLAKPRPAPTFGAFRAIVDDILIADRDAPSKQRHTATQIFRRLVAENNYAGGYDQVRRYGSVRKGVQRLIVIEATGVVKTDVLMNLLDVLALDLGTFEDLCERLYLTGHQPPVPPGTVNCQSAPVPGPENTENTGR